MKIKGHFVKILSNVPRPPKATIKDPTLLIAINNNLPIEIMPEKYYKKFRSLESYFSIHLVQYSLLTSIGRFAPEKAYIQYLLDKKLIQEFNNIKNEIILSYDTFAPFIKEKNKDLINKVWDIIHKDGGKPTENFIIETNKKIIDLLPTKEDLYNSINFKILTFKTVDSEECDKIIIQEIKNELINIILDAFNKLINFYNGNKQIRPNMLACFIKEINRICLLYFCRNIEDDVKGILKKIYDEEYKVDPNLFIDYLIETKKDLLKEVENFV